MTEDGKEFWKRIDRKVRRERWRLSMLTETAIFILLACGVICAISPKRQSAALVVAIIAMVLAALRAFGVIPR